MGRSGSRYLTVERCYGLDLAKLTQLGFLSPGKKATGPWCWASSDKPDETAATVEVTCDLRELDAPTFTILYKSGEERIEIQGALLTTQPHYGGIRYWFGCPRCGMARRWLYAYPQTRRHRFACRRCHGLRYYSHRESHPDRLSRKAKKLWRRAGGEDGCEPWQKPKWMRWATFSRLVLAGRAAQEEADRIILGRLGVQLASIMRRHGSQ